MSDHRCYDIGPTLAADEPPFPLLWEQNPLLDDPIEGCDHLRWELVLLAANGPNEKGRARIEEVVRCADCHVPRCGHSQDVDPCILRRHHSGEHETCSQWQRSMRSADAHVLPMIHAHKAGRDISTWSPFEDKNQ